MALLAVRVTRHPAHSPRENTPRASRVAEIANAWRCRIAAAVVSVVIQGVLQQPGAEELNEFLNRFLATGDCMVLVSGEAELEYTGRAASRAEAGDYLTMVKRDGTLLVHGPVGVKPVNWQPLSTRVSARVERGLATLTAERIKPPERVVVTFTEPAFAGAFTLRQPGDFRLSGSEADLQAGLRRQPQLLEPGLKVLGRELPVPVGGIDLLAVDRLGRLVVVELKRAKAGHEAVQQLERYVQAVRSQERGAVRGMLAAPAITAPALRQLERNNLEFVAIDPALLEPQPATQDPLFDFDEL